MQRYETVCRAPNPCDGVATPDVDYVSFAKTPVTLTYKLGRQVETFKVTLIGDTTREDNENINIRFAGSTGPWNMPVLWDNNAEVLITNDDQ